MIIYSRNITLLSLRLIVFKSALELGEKVNEHLLQMYGIRKDVPPLRASDIALITNYQYILNDAFGNQMDVVNLFHITIKGAIGEDDYINDWFILYDREQ